MNFKEQIENYLNDHGGELPWRLGESDSLSGVAESVRGMLPLWQRLLVSRFNPYRRYRNNGLLALRKGGVALIVLSELSGLHQNSITKCFTRLKHEKD